MKKGMLVFFAMLLLVVVFASPAIAQCSICTKTASQLGEKPAKALNAGILYLMLTPLTVAGYIGMRWWKREKAYMQAEGKQ